MCVCAACMCVCVCVFVYVCALLCTRMHACVHVHVCMHVCVRARMFVYIPVLLSGHTCAFRHRHAHTIAQVVWTSIKTLQKQTKEKKETNKLKKLSVSSM